MLDLNPEQWPAIQCDCDTESHLQYVQNVIAIWRVFYQMVMPGYPQLSDATIEFWIEHCLAFCAKLEGATVQAAAEFTLYVLAAVLQGRSMSYITEMEEFFRDAAPSYGIALSWIRYELFHVMSASSLVP